MIHAACIPTLHMSFSPIWFQLKGSIIVGNCFLEIPFIKKRLSSFKAGRSFIAVIDLGKNFKAAHQEQREKPRSF